MEGKYYVSVCQECGKRNTNRHHFNKLGPNTAPTPVPGKCPNTPDGKHRPKWEEA